MAQSQENPSITQKTHYLNDFKASDWNESKKTHLSPIWVFLLSFQSEVRNEVTGWVFSFYRGGQGSTGAAAEVPTPAVFAQGGGASRPGAGWVIASSLLLQNAEVSAEWLGLVVIIVIIVVIIVIVFLANGHHRYLLGSGSGSGRCRWSRLLLITCDQAQRHAISICCHICHSRYMMISRTILV